MASIHKYKIEGIEGEEINFANFKGKKIIVVNVASECGYTPQYQQLQELFEAFKDKLVIIGLPSNDFGGQEPGTNTEIRSFCTEKHGVSFPLSKKITIIGENQHPLYQWLTQKSKNAVLDSEVKWNFQKYLLDENGHLVKSVSSGISPLSEEILDWVQQ